MIEQEHLHRMMYDDLIPPACVCMCAGSPPEGATRGLHQAVERSRKTLQEWEERRTDPGQEHRSQKGYERTGIMWSHCRCSHHSYSYQCIFETVQRFPTDFAYLENLINSYCLIVTVYTWAQGNSSDCNTYKVTANPLLGSDFKIWLSLDFRFDLDFWCVSKHIKCRFHLRFLFTWTLTVKLGSTGILLWLLLSQKTGKTLIHVKYVKCGDHQTDGLLI